MDGTHICVCRDCGRTLNTNGRWEQINRKQAGALWKLLLAVRHYGRNEVHIRREMFEVKDALFQLSYDEINNFGKLRVHGLAVHVEHEGQRKAGYWLLTRRGSLFLKNLAAIPLRVRVVDGHPVEHSQQTIYLRDLAWNEPWYSQIPPFDVEHPERSRAPEIKQAILL